MNGWAFLDASFWIAFRDDRQELHSCAGKAMIEMHRRKIRFVTTLPVLCETHAHFSRRLKQKLLLINDFESNPLIHVEPVSEMDQQQAFELLRRHSDKNYSLCDALSFAVMRRLKMGRAVSFDKHFRQFGEFEIIPDRFP